MRIGGITLCTGSIGCGRLFFRSSIWADRISIASFAITEICCPTVLVGMTASREIGESSNPMICQVSGSSPYFRRRTFS